MRISTSLFVSLALAMAVSATSASANSWLQTNRLATTAGDETNDELPDGVVCDLPYSQSFDNENNDYDGTTFVPNGWLATGSAPFVTSNMDGLTAKDGEWYVIAPESSVSRDDRLYTPFFHLEKGMEYSISFYLYMPGNTTYGRVSNFDFTVGTEQDAELHSSLLALEGYHNSGWELKTVKYSPESTGYYCFSFALSGNDAIAGEVAIDLFNITAEGLKNRPRAAFSFGGHFNLMNSHMVYFSRAEVQMVNQSTDADNFLWKVGGPMDITSTEANPKFKFNKNGDYTIQLTATSDKGTSTYTETVSVDAVDDATQMPISTANPKQDALTSRSDMKAFSTDTGADWVTGVNHYYKHFAQKFDLPDDFDYTITSANFYLCYYNISSRCYNTEITKPFKVVVYGDKNGRPDLDNVYGSYQTTMMGAFGTTGLGIAEMRMIKFAKPITAHGTFYLAFEFPEDLWITENDANLSRTCVGFGGINHRSNQTTLYVQPTAVPEECTLTPDGGYYPVDNLDASLAGTGLNLVVWMNVKNNGESAIALTSDGKVAFATHIVDGTLWVSGTTQGESVTLYNLSGAVVATAKAAAQSTSFNVESLPAGVYIVKTAAGTQKILKR